MGVLVFITADRAEKADISGSTGIRICLKSDVFGTYLCSIIGAAVKDRVAGTGDVFLDQSTEWSIFGRGAFPPARAEAKGAAIGYNPDLVKPYQI